jgi:signal transduction histidine kinase/ActR/RegA family two-component response regulator/HAMP domain-containing protein
LTHTDFPSPVAEAMMAVFNLKTKMTLVVSLLVASLISVMAFVALDYFEHEFKRMIGEQQFGMITAMAGEIDDKLAYFQQELSNVASTLHAADTKDHHSARQFLVRHPDTASDFDNGLFVFDTGGRLLAGTAPQPHREPTDYARREFFRKAVASGNPQISEPLHSTQQHSRPVVMFAAPAFDAAHRITAVLVGSLDLMKDNFLGRLAAISLGNNGYLYLYSTDRTIIVHRDRQRILKQDVPIGANRLFDRAIAGFEGTGETVTSRGLHVLSSFKHLRTTNWILSANYPQVDAYAPVGKARQYLGAALVLVVAISVGIVWLAMHRLTAPLSRLTSHVGRLSEGSEVPPLQVSSRDEIGTLVTAFNTLVEGLGRQRTALREQMEFSENLIRNSTVPTFVLDTAHRVIIWNAACEELTGRSSADMIGSLDTWRIFYSEPRPCLADLIIDGRQAEAGQHYDISGASGLLAEGLHAEGWFPSLNGGARYLAFNAAPIRNGDGVMIAVIETLEDMTAWKNHENEIKRAVSMLEATLESTVDGILVVDQAGRTVATNRKFADMWRIPEETSATHDSRLLLEAIQDQLKDPAAFRATIDELYGTPDMESFDVLEFKDGRTFERVSIPQRIDRVNVGRVWSFRDVTAQRKLEAQLRHALKMEAIGTLTGGVAHDFNNILTAIVGYGSMLKMQLPADGPLQRYIDQVLSAADRATSLTRSLLTYSRKQPVNLRPLDLNESVLRVKNLLERLIGEDVELDISLAPGPLTILADSGQIEQILMNLVSNARDAIERHGSLTIRTEPGVIDQQFIATFGYGRPGNYAILSVADSGAGMDAATVERIFEPFFTTKEVGKGTGLGLAIIYGIVKQHGGYINVQSEPGEGTTFRILLPLTEPRDAAVADQVRLVAGGGSETILLIEDNEQVRQLYHDLLSGYGYRVLTAADGEAGLALFLSHRESIALVILDVIMPKKNGRETLAAIRQFQPEMKALFMSGYTAEIIQREEIHQTGLHFLSKPVTPDAFLAKIREILDQAGHEAPKQAR